jgi:hypothetical protein
MVIFLLRCYGVVTDVWPIRWSPLALCTADARYVCHATSGVLVPQCTSGDDCNQNGVCDNGACACDSGWGGADCSRLQLGVATASSGYNTPSQSTGRSSWGGSIIFDPHTQRWQMFAAEMVHGCVVLFIHR